MNNFKATWTGSYPALCLCADWRITHNNFLIKWPEELEEQRTSDMGTYGSYQSWHFEDWMDVFESYTDGDEKDEWVVNNKEWLTKLLEFNNIEATQENFEDFYDAVSLQDFRSGSCGGCI